MSQPDQNYVFIPQRLLADLSANPAAIGVYALIARLFLIYQEPIPLSAADLQRYDPTLSYGAARGALQRLVTLRWLADHSGHKNNYTPTWGVIKGAASPWQMDAPTLGRPAHIVTMRLDRRLLDIGLGKLVPHPTYPAQTKDRYLERPIFSLRDVGVYAQVLNGQVFAATPALQRYGLIRDGVAQPLTSATELIALASQRTLEGDGAAPTEQGLRKLGIILSSAPPATASGKPLFFVDPGLIPDPITCSIPNLIPLGAETKHPSSATECAQTGTATYASHMAGTPGIMSETSDSPPNPPARRNGGGGNDQSANKQGEPARGRPETVSAQLLRAIRAFPSSIAELADMPAELVEEAIAYAESEPGIESIPGWVVEALRRHRDEGWPIPAPRTRQKGLTGRDGSIDVGAYTSGAYGDLFRLGSDTSDLEASTIDQNEGAFGAPSTGALEPPSDTLHVYEESFSATDTASVGAGRPASSAPPESTDDTLTRQVQAELRMRCGRQRGRVIEGLRVHAIGYTSRIVCATCVDMDIVQHEMIGALHRILEQLGAPSQLVFTICAGSGAQHRNARDTRSRPNTRQHGPSLT